MNRWIPAAGAVAALAVAVAFAVAPVGAQTGTIYACINSSHQFTHVSAASPLACPSQTPVNWPGNVPGPPPSPSPSATTPAPSPSATASPSPSPTGTSGACTAQLGGACSFEDTAFWQGSNGYNTYVTDQGVNVTSGGTGSITAVSPSQWSAVANYKPCGGCVQTFTAVDQLTNNWGGSGWNCGTTCTDTPIAALSSLSITYDETSPSDAGDQYEFAPDIWTNYAGQLCGGCGDVMMWVDTSPQRCPAVSGWPLLGHPVIDGQNWTAYVAPSVKGDEIIFILDGAGGPGTCAQQGKGTIDVYAALQWLSANPGGTGFPAFSSLTMSQLNTGWEITDGAGGTYRVNDLAYHATVS